MKATIPTVPSVKSAVQEFSEAELRHMLTASNYRALSQGTAEVYFREMNAGRWRMTGEPIIFDTQGRLMDGQHRLAAALMMIEAGKRPPSFLCVYGIDRETESLIDTGRARTFRDYCAAHGVAYSTTVGPIISAIARQRRSYPGLPFEMSARVFTGDKIMPSELLDIIREPGMEEAATDWARICFQCSASGGPVARGMFAAVTWFISRRSYELCREFVDRMGDGANQDVGSPILRLRKILVHDWSNPIKRMPGFAAAPLIIKAWNMFATGVSTCTRLSYIAGGERPESFPQIVVPRGSRF